MEQNRASPVQFHHPKLAWQAGAEPSNCGQLERQHNDDNGLDRSRSPGHPALRNRTQSKRRTNGQTQVNTSRIPWRMELLPCASADVKLVQVIYARALSVWISWRISRGRSKAAKNCAVSSRVKPAKTKGLQAMPAGGTNGGEGADDTKKWKPAKP